ncbi:hypothetical protein MG293_007585 [Ovis ammon polii]|uniref:Uncharacterized protein n=1 Tax=Ovis ammon polii TaxID=230172 RepID=A0AAD4UBU3_OVIAM|nr:hypothetical protein MG293_007585 [Ovis ammon polii]
MQETACPKLPFGREKTSAIRSVRCSPPFDRESKVFFCLKDKVCTVAPEGDWRVEDKSKDYAASLLDIAISFVVETGKQEQEGFVLVKEEEANNEGKEIYKNFELLIGQKIGSKLIIQVKDD